jgi:hypothetical protein
MGFRVLVGDPISEGPRLCPDNSSHGERYARGLDVENDTSVFPVALLENAVTRPIAYQGEEVCGLPKP